MNNHATVQSSAPVSAAPLLQVSGALIAIIALILAAAWLVKREQGGKKQYHDKAEINDMTRPQAACEFFQPALVFHFCLVLHPDDSQPAFL